MAETGTAPSSPAAQAAAARLAGIRPPTAPPAAEPAPAEAGGKGKKKRKKGEGEAGAKKKKPVKLIAVFVVLLLVAYVAKGKFVKPHYGPHAKVPLGAIYDLPNQVTTNLRDGGLAQISMSLQLTAAANKKEITKDTSAIMGTAVDLIGSMTYASVLSHPDPQVYLEHALLSPIQRDLGTNEGAQQVAGVIFTYFVIQQQ